MITSQVLPANYGFSVFKRFSELPQASVKRSRKIRLAKMTDDELHNLVRQRLLGVLANNRSRQKIIALGEIERYLAEGWEYVASIPNNRAIVRIPF